MSRIEDVTVNPYEPPRCIEQPKPTVMELMNELRREYDGRFGQLAMDVAMAEEFSAAFGMIASWLSDSSLYVGMSASAPIIFFVVESTRDFIRVVQGFPGRMEELRKRLSENSEECTHNDSCVV